MRTHQKVSHGGIHQYLVGEEDLLFSNSRHKQLGNKNRHTNLFIQETIYCRPMTMMTRSLLLFTLTWVSTTIQSSLAFLPPNAGSLSPTATKSIAKSSTQHYFKSPLVQEALEQCVIDVCKQSQVAQWKTYVWPFVPPLFRRRHFSHLHSKERIVQCVLWLLNRTSQQIKNNL